MDSVALRRNHHCNLVGDGSREPIAVGGGRRIQIVRGRPTGVRGDFHRRSTGSLTMQTPGRFYEYRHKVCLEETNLVGNVYYTNHLSWQGRCRELFLREHAPDVIDELSRGFSLATVSCSCEYFAELTVFEEVIVRMRLAELVQNRMRLGFEFWRHIGGGEELVARGDQQIACMRREGEKLVPAPVPPSLREALAAYAE